MMGDRSPLAGLSDAELIGHLGGAIRDHDTAMPVSGRSEPRPSLKGISCDVRWRHDAAGIYYECMPCRVRQHVEDGYTDAQLTRAAAMHRGEVPS